MRGVALLVGCGLLAAACDDSEDLATLEQPLDSDVVINEHSAGSSGWVELTNIGTADVDVSGWTIDDITGGGTAPKSIAAGSVVPAGGFLVVTYSGLNTASADTLHLLNGAGATIDSHTNGYAGSSIAGLCFGRRPDGRDWAAAAIPCSRGASNGDAIPPPPPAAVVLNEFQAGSAGWLELYNPGDAPLDLGGWAVDDIAGGGTSPKAIAAGTGIAAGGFRVVTYSGINTASADEVRLVDAGGATVDSHSNFHAGSSIAGLCFGRRPDGRDWAAAAIPCSQGAGNGGTVPPPPAAVVINEFNPGSAGWLELYNPGGTAIDLGGWIVDDIAGGGTSPKTIAAGTTIAAGGFRVVTYAGINTASADEVRVLDPAGVVVDSHANFFGVDPCYGGARCYGRLPDGGAWAPAHIPCSHGTANPASAPALCVPGSACDDGDACTTGDTCSTACACTAGPPRSCDDGNSCTSDVCLPASGCANPAAPDGLACDAGATCLGGVCGGTEPTPCVATGGTYKTVAFSRAEECQAVAFLNRARYSQMNPIATTARDIAYDCTPTFFCGYRSAVWTTVAEYAAARNPAGTLTVGTSSLLALRTASAAWVDDAQWYDTVERTYADRTALNGLWVHFEKVVAEYGGGLCLLVRDTAGAPSWLSACFDPWFCGPEGCPADYARTYDGRTLSIRGRLTNETGSWRVAIKSARNANPAIP
jgi:hypothetical protein